MSHVCTNFWQCHQTPSGVALPCITPVRPLPFPLPQTIAAPTCRADSCFRNPIYEVRVAWLWKVLTNRTGSKFISYAKFMKFFSVPGHLSRPFECPVEPRPNLKVRPCDSRSANPIESTVTVRFRSDGSARCLAGAAAPY